MKATTAPVSADIHVRALMESAFLSKCAAEMGIPMKGAVEPLQVIDVLNRGKISFVLIGAHGIGGWMHEPRATQDVDVIVAAKHEKKAVKLLLEAFPHLEGEDHPVVVRLRERDGGEVRIDVVKTTQQLYRQAFKHKHAVEVKRRRYFIPTLAMAVAMKFATMLSPTRQEKDKYQDAHDFINMVQANPDLDLDKLHELAELAYTGGGARVRQLVEDARAGRRLVL